MPKVIHIDRLRRALREKGNPYFNVLLVFGGPLGNAMGDTLIATNHYKFLRTAFRKIRLTVWTADTDIWHSVCAKEVECRPFISENEVQHDFDLIVLDWVSSDHRIENLFSSESAVVINIPPGSNSLRYFLPNKNWTTVKLLPRINHTLRLNQAYGALGVAVDETGIKGTSIGEKSTLYLNPYASSAEKCLTASVFAHLLCELPQVWTRGPILCPSVPDPVPDLQLRYYLRLDALIKDAVRNKKVQQLSPMNRTEYISRVKGSRLIIGPDTSSQHIASLYDIPCISCYPNKSSYKYYRWAPPGALSLCFHLPPENDEVKVAAFAELICSLAKIINHDFEKDSPKEGLADDFIKICRAVASRTMSSQEGKVRISQTISKLNEFLPSSWRSFVIPELEQIGAEVCKRSTQTTNVTDKLGLLVISDIFALKTVSLLRSRYKERDVRLERA